MPTLIEVVRLSTSFLAQRGGETARLDAELLTAHSLGLRRLDLYLQHDRPLREDELEPIRALLRRRAQGEPVAYIVGEREFYGRIFRVTPAVLIPRPDTETLVEAALQWARGQGRPLRIADVGTGSGCIAVTMAAELPDATVVANDISPDALDVARENARRLEVGERVTFVEGALRDDEPIDMLLSNPPYVTENELAELAVDVRNYEPREALVAGEDGMQAYRAILGNAPRAAYVALEVDPRRAAQVATLVAQTWPRATTRCIKDLTTRDRVVEALIP